MYEHYKSTDSDGIRADFSKVFWNDLKSFYIKPLNSFFENGSLSIY